jgi:hypothetical protein
MSVGVRLKVKTDVSYALRQGEKKNGKERKKGGRKN